LHRQLLPVLPGCFPLPFFQRKRLLLPLPFSAALIASAQTYTPVTVTGYNADVIANGATFAGSTTADVDGGGFYFYDQTFTALGTPTQGLPTSGTINSLATTGLVFQMAGATVNNSLRLDATTTSGTLTLSSPQPAGVLYLLLTSGTGTSTINITVNFTDATSMVFNNQTIPDWFDAFTLPIAAQGFGRTSATALGALAPLIHVFIKWR
jgi:hypothetical protein